MEGRLGRLHCRYSMIGGRGSAGAVQAALDRLARERVAGEYVAALDKVLGETETVHVVRHVDSPVLFATEAGISDPRFARRWGERLAGAVLRKLAEGNDDRENFVSFNDQADYIAHFIRDLLDGVAWDRWYYGAFAPLRTLSTAEALRRALLDNRPHLSAVLGSLHRGQTSRGPLEKALALLDDRTLRAIWREGPASQMPASGDALRPIFAAALRLAGELDLWRQPRRAGEELFQEYLATRPAAPDWRDRRGLAAAVFDILLFWSARGNMRRMPTPPDEALLDHVLANLDWADADWLRAALLDWIREAAAMRSESPTPPAGNHPAESPTPSARKHTIRAGRDAPDAAAELPLRPAGRGATPRQRELLADLAAALGDDALHLDFEQFDGAANAIRLYAALVARAPRWADDPAATGIIRQLLTAWSFVRRSDAAAECLRRLREGDAAGAARTLPTAARGKAEPVFKFITALADAARAALDRLARLDRKIAQAAPFTATDAPAFPESGVETDCAGTALLLRAVADARLSALAEQAGFPAVGPLTPFSAMFLALCLRWNGARAVANSHIDAGLSLIAGLQPPPAFDDLRDAWAGTTPEHCLRFQAGLFGILAGQRFAQTSTLRLYRIPIANGREALVAGDETGLLWPLGRVIEGGDAIAPAVEELLRTWIASAGCAPSVITADALPDGWDARIAPPRHERPVVIVSDPEHEDEDVVHAAGRKALLDALGLFDAGQLGQLVKPDVDLTVALSAAALLRMWARWLRQFADSSHSYLLTNFLDRRGRISLGDEVLLVELDRRPLDIVLEMAGYTADLERVPWLGGRTLRFQIVGK